MTREDSLRTKTWVTNDGRYLAVNEISDDHLHNIRQMMLDDLPPGYDQVAGRKVASDWMARPESLLNYTIDGTWAELDRDAYASAWLQIIKDELALREHGASHKT